MNKFKKWNKKPIEDWGSEMSDDAKAFYKAFKSFIKRSFPEATLIGFKPNHYDFSGFIYKDNKYVYVSHSINRYNIDAYNSYVDFDDNSVTNGVLYRTAENDHDYRGGKNNFTSINNMVEDIMKIFMNRS